MRWFVILGLVLAVGCGIPWCLSAVAAIEFWGGYSSEGPNEALYGATFFGSFSLLGLVSAGFAYVKVRLDRIESHVSGRTPAWRSRPPEVSDAARPGPLPRE